MTVTALRWVIKKTARRIAGAIPAKPARGLRALTYHGFGEAVRDPFTVSAPAFEAQIAAIAQEGMALRPCEVVDFVGGARFPGRVTVTIDDGLADVARIALPILQRYDVGALLFVVRDWIGRAGHMDATAIRQAADAGFEIGSHSLSHPIVARLSPAAQRAEIVGSRAALEDVIGKPVRGFAYPYGTRFAYSDRSRALVAEAGYTLAFTTQHGAIDARSDPLELPRIKVEGGDDPRLFHALCRGALDKWIVVDRGLSLFQQPGRDRSA